MTATRVFLAIAAGAAVLAVTPPVHAFLGSAAGGPHEVLILRHAEEPKGADPNLNAAGKARAKGLAQWIPATYGKPDVLFANHATDKSRRAVDTLEPLAAALHLKIQDQFKNEDFQKLAARLLSDQQFAGKRILICWNKGNIAKLATALGVRKTPDWPDSQYDHIWRLQFGAGGVTLDDAVQKLPAGGK